jgi:stage III sporulation protein AF
MLEIVKNWAMAVSVAVLIGTVLEMLLPDTSVKKYVKFAIGLVILIVVIMPVIGLFTGKADVKGELGAAFSGIEKRISEYEEKDITAYKDYVYEVYMRNKKNKNE